MTLLEQLGAAIWGVALFSLPSFTVPPFSECRTAPYDSHFSVGLPVLDSGLALASSLFPAVDGFLFPRSRSLCDC
jgi:hypothetical protein